MKGTICKIDKFINNQDFELKVEINGIPSNYLKFKAGRELIIPMYQREIRWDESNVNVFLNDVLNKAKFLGNVFLAELNGNYEVIDGQQRISTVYILLCILIKNHAQKYNKLDELNLLKLKNDSFPNFYDESIIFEDEIDEAQDPFNQQKRYRKIHTVVKEFLEKQTEEKLVQFCENILDCSLNVIILENEENKNAIDGFIDINVKGVKLDSEDILKGYFFKKSNNSKNLWINLKMEYFKLNKLEPGIDLIDLLYNTIFCILKNDNISKLKEVKYDKNFELEFDFNLDDNGSKKNYNKGTHLMELIHNATLIDKIIINTTEFIKLNIKFSSNNISAHSELFSNAFGLLQANSTTRDIYFKMISTLIRNQLVNYKFLVVYCFVSAKNDYGDEKKYREMIECFYLYSFFWDALSSRKGVHMMAKELGEIKEITSKVYELTKNLFDNGSVPKVNFKQKMCFVDERSTKAETNAKYTVLHLASIYECFKLDRSNCKIKFNKENFTKLNTLTLEHFVINESGKYKTDCGKLEPYPFEHSKQKNVIVNLVPLDKDINNELGNKHLQGKINYIDEKLSLSNDFFKENACKYTEMYYGTIKKYYQDNAVSEYELVDNFDEILSIIYKKICANLYENM